MRTNQGKNNNGQTYRVDWFDSVSEWMAQPFPPKKVNAEAPAWRGARGGFRGYTLDTSKEYFLNGAKPDQIEAAKQLMDKLNAEIHESQHHVWQAAPYGAYPVVPDYLMGNPFSMRAKVTEQSTHAPVKIVMYIGVAAGLSQDQIAKRAAAMAAFAMKLSEHRAVELWMSDAGYNNVINRDVVFAVKLDSPINISQAVAVFQIPVNRMLALSYMEYQSMGNIIGQTASPYYFQLKGISAYGGRGVPFMNAFKEYLELSEEDIILGPGILTDATAIDADPVKWVKDMLAKYGEQTED